MGRTQPAASPERADPGRSAGPCRRRRRDLLQLRLRDLGADHSEGGRHRRGQALVSGRLLADISRSLPAEASRHHRRRHQDGAGLRQRPLHPADSAGRRLPVAAPMPEATGTVPSDCVRPGGLPGRGRRRPRRAAAGVHRRTGGDRGRHHLAAGHRPLSDGAEGTDLEPELHPDLGDRAGTGARCSTRRPAR